MDWDEVDWQALARLRTAFLTGTAGAHDYWKTDRQLASYDFTFGQRIRWKLDFVFADLKRRHWSPPAGVALDWGCGTGIASRAFLEHFGHGSVSQLILTDRSAAAMRFAANRIAGVPPWTETNPQGPVAVLLVSHVLTELAPAATEELVVLARQATTVIWVEPGTPAASRALATIRERLRAQFQLVAPCTHQAPCGVLAAGNERHWCHQFAPSPPTTFTDGYWARFAKLAGIDLRSLPVSFLVLDRRPVPARPPDTTRLIGRPRVYKAYAKLLGCNETGVRERRLTKRRLPAAFRQARKDTLPSVAVWRGADDEILAVSPDTDIP
ncbi:hypothetical protein HQ590_06480 [bacterium]|nr:hypothetical protein [bacterium]